jgi:MarR family
MTRLIERLERDGLVERSRSETDSRQVYAQITERGLERLGDAAKTHFQGVRMRFLDHLSATQTQALARVWIKLLPPTSMSSDRSSPSRPKRPAMRPMARARDKTTPVTVTLGGAAACCFAWKEASREALRRRSKGTTFESADRSRADSCFAVAEQASEEPGPALLVFV